MDLTFCVPNAESRLHRFAVTNDSDPDSEFEDDIAAPDREETVSITLREQSHDWDGINDDGLYPVNGNEDEDIDEEARPRPRGRPKKGSASLGSGSTCSVHNCPGRVTVSIGLQDWLMKQQEEAAAEAAERLKRRKVDP